MAFLAAAIVVGPERIPFLVGHRSGERQAGQDDRAFRHACDRREQRGDRRRGGGDAGGDGEAGWRLPLPALRRRPKQAVAPLGEVDDAASLQHCRPTLDDCPQPLERHLPVFGELGIVGGDVLEAGGRNFLDRQRVERPRQVGGDAAALRLPPSPSLRTSAASASSRASGSIAGGIGSLASAGSSAPPMRSSSSGSPMAIRRGRTQPAAAGADEGLGQRPHRAVVGQQDAPAGERQRLAAVLPHQPGDERVREAAMRRDSEDRGPAARQASTRAASVARIEAGVPTSNHRPWWTAPKQRPSAIARSHRMLVEKGPSGASLSRRLETIWMPVKTIGRDLATGRAAAAGRSGPCESRRGRDG